MRLEWISAAEGARFAQIIDEFIEQLRQLGPSPVTGNGGPAADIPTSEAEEVEARV